MSEEGSVLAGNPVEEQGNVEESAPATSELTASEWVSDEYKSFADNKGWKNSDDVLKSYVNLEKQIGQDRVALPNEGDDVAEWEGWSKLGTPETADGYELNVPQGYEEYSSDLSDWFRQEAHAAKVPASMAQRLHDAYVQRMMDGQSNSVLDQQRQFEDWGNEIKKEYGTAYDEKVGMARRAVRAFGSDNLSNMLNDTGLGNHPEMIRAFAKIGAELSTSRQFKDSEEAGSFSMTPENARAEIARIRSHSGLTNKGDPEHRVLNDRLTQLYEIAHPADAA
jgi:plasmid replication initiation protein